MQPNGNDIRFVSANECCKNIPYFIETGINTPNTVIWLRTDSLPINTSATYVMLYGNDTASSKSNPANVFDWYEEFSNTGSKFTMACSGSNALEISLGGKHTFSWQQSGIWISDSTFNNTKPLLVEAKVDTFIGSNPGLYILKSGKKQGYGIQYRGNAFATTVTQPSDSGYCEEHIPVSNNVGAMNPKIWSVAWVNTGFQQACLNGTPPWNTNDTQVVKNQPVKIALGGTENGTGSFTLDWVRARKWSDAPPFYVIGAETPNPQPDFLGPDQTTCFGQMVTFDAGGNGLPYYSWSTSSADPAITVGTPGLYNVTSYLYNCLVFDYVTLSINPLPPVNGVANPSLICAGDTSMLTVTGADSYVWVPSNSTNDTLVFSVEHNTPILVTGTDTNGCSKTDTVILNVATPDLHFPDSISACGVALLNAGNPGSTYIWSNGFTTQSISVTSSGKFWVHVTDGLLGCENSDTLIVDIRPLPVATFTVPQDTLCSDASAIALTGGAPGGGYYYGPGVNGNMFVPSNANNGANILYYVFTDSNFCRDTASVLVVTEICLGVNNRYADGFELYPNPVRIGSNLLFKNLSQQATLRVINAQGIQVATYNSSNIYVADNTFSAGVYFVEVNIGNLRQIKKVVVTD